MAVIGLLVPKRRYRWHVDECLLPVFLAQLMLNSVSVYDEKIDIYLDFQRNSDSRSSPSNLITTKYIVLEIKPFPLPLPIIFLHCRHHAVHDHTDINDHAVTNKDIRNKSFRFILKSYNVLQSGETQNTSLHACTVNIWFLLELKHIQMWRCLPERCSCWCRHWTVHVVSCACP